jgi:hypothetical protein
VTVVVPTTDLRCPAVLALEREGVDHTPILVEDDQHYGRILAEHWPFTVLEHDVVPWVGAFDKLAECPEPWCVHMYPFAPNAVRWALGCSRVHPGVAEQFPNLPDVWGAVAWNQLDGVVSPALIRAVGKPHIHSPAFAHVKG